MGYRIKQIIASGLEALGGYNYVVAEVDAATDFAALTAFQDGSVGYIKGDPDSLYHKVSGTWTKVDKSLLANDNLLIDGVSPHALLLANILFPRRAELTAIDKLTTRGDLLYRAASAYARLPKGTAGQVLLQGASDPAWASPDGLAVSDAGGYYTTDTLVAMLQQLGPVIAELVPELHQYYIRAAVPTLETDIFEGMILYTTGDHALQCCTTPGEQEDDTVTVTGPATASGNVTITLNGTGVTIAVVGGTLDVHNATITAGASASGDLTVTLDGTPVTVAVLAEDTAAAVAGKITTAYSGNADWTVVNTDAVLTFTAKAKGVKSGAFTLGVAATGVTCTAGITQTTPGVAADTAEGVATKIKATAFTGWTTGGTGAICTFKKNALGACSAPTAGAASTGVTFSTFTRTNQGVNSVWGTCINAA